MSQIHGKRINETRSQVIIREGLNNSMKRKAKMKKVGGERKKRKGGNGEREEMKKKIKAGSRRGRR